MSTRRTLTRRSLAVAATVAVTLAACGSDDASDEALPPVEAEAPSANDGTDVEGGTDAGATETEMVQQNGTVSFELGTQLPPHGDGPDEAVGMPAPVVDGERFDTTAITIGGETEGPMLYIFLAHWCPHCNDEIPELISLLDDDRLPADLDVVGISTAVAADRDNYPPSEWLVEKGWPWDAMADDDQLTAMNVYGGTSFPFSVLVGADGTVLARRAGSAPADDILAWIEDGLAAA